MNDIVPPTIERLLEGKQKLRRARIEMSLPEKVRQVIELQKIYVAIVGQRRPLLDRERVWDWHD